MLKPVIRSNLQNALGIAPACYQTMATSCAVASFHLVERDDEDHDGTTVIVD